MDRYRLRGVAFALVILLSLLPIGAPAQDSSDSPPCDFQKLEALRVALDFSSENLLADPDDPEAEAAVRVAMVAFHDYLTSCFPSPEAAGANLSTGTTAAVTEDTCPAETIVLYVDHTAAGSGDGTSWTDAYTDLQAALAAAGGAKSRVEIWIAEGTYKPTTGIDRTATFQLKNCVALYGGFDGTETARGERDWEVNLTLLSGDIRAPHDEGDNIYHVVTGSSTDASAVLDGFTVTGGNSYGPWPYVAGGGMYSEGGSPTLSNVLFSGNRANYAGGAVCNFGGGSPALSNVLFSGNGAEYAGGGMYNIGGKMTLSNAAFSNNGASNGGGMYNADGNPTLTNVTFSNNMDGGMYNWDGSPTLTHVTFSDNLGGGMYNHDGNSTLTNVTFSDNSGRGMGNWDGNPTLTHVTFSDNLGGGMYNHDGNPTLTDVTFSDNSGLRGGGMDSLGGSSTLTDVTFSGNTADRGGGMYNRGNSNVTLTNVTFSGNSATANGGGMFNHRGISATLAEVTFSDNSATGNGGGMFNFGSSPTLTNVTFTHNSASLSGGGMFNSGVGKVALTNVIFSHNSAVDRGGGILNFQSSPTLANVTFSGNTAGVSGGGMSNLGGSPTLTNTTFSDNSAGRGGGVSNESSHLTIRNSIVWGNAPDPIVDDPNSSSAVSYSDIEGGRPGTGNINADPWFTDAGSGDLRLNPSSPAINSGNNDYLPADVTVDLDGNPRIVGGVVDMGAYEFPVQIETLFHYLPAVAR